MGFYTNEKRLSVIMLKYIFCILHLRLSPLKCGFRACTEICEWQHWKYERDPGHPRQRILDWSH